MADSQSGTTPPDGGDTGTQGAAGANGTQTPEELKAEVERLTRLHQQSLAEKSNLEATKRENELLKQERESLLQRASAPPAAQPSNTPEAFLDSYARDIQEAQMEVAADPDNSVKRLILKNAQIAYADLQNKLNNHHRQNELTRQRPKIEAAPKELQQRAWQLLESGAVSNAELAIATARGEALAALDPGSEAERLRKAKEQAAQDEQSRAALAGKVTTSTAAVTAEGNSLRKISLEDYNRRVAAGDKALIASVDKKEVEVTF